MSVANSAPTIPTGVILPFAGYNVAEGWLPCTGAVYDPVEYPRLYETIGNIFGGTATAPLLPDLRAKYPVGLETGVSTIGEITPATFTGTESFTLADNNIPSLTFSGGVSASGTFTTPLLGYESEAQTNTSSSYQPVIVSINGPVTTGGAINVTTTGAEITYTNPNPPTQVSYSPVATAVAYAGYDILYIIKASGF